MSFGVPIVWCHQVDYHSDCYFSMTKLSRFFLKKNRSKLVYPDCQSALKPIPHNLVISVPISP